MGLTIGNNIGLRQLSKKAGISASGLMQRLFKENSTISINNGTKAVDYSSALVNADICQPCLYTETQYQLAFNENIVINWATDGIKAEFVAKLKTGGTTSDILMGSTINHGFRLYSTMLRIYGFKADGSTLQDIQFTSITTAANTWFRYRVTKSGNNIVAEKTTPDDLNFTSGTKVTQSINVSTYNLGNQTFNKIMPVGGLCYLNANGFKFSFSEGSTFTLYSFNSGKRISATINTIFSTTQNVYCHNAIYGYSRAYVEYSTKKEYVNIAYQEDGTPATGFHSAYFTRSKFVEFPALKSFGLGYAIRLAPSMEAYDQANTFFDASHIAKEVYKNNIPSKLNSRLFFDHAKNAELLIYNENKTIRRPINTAGKKVLVVGDSMASDSYFWPILLSNLCGFVRTTKAFAGRTLSTHIQSDLAYQVSLTPTLISGQDFIILCGGFNDFDQNISLSVFTTGLAALYAYIRSQNATAPIIVCGPYNWGNPIDSGATPNSGGMTRNSLRQAMAELVTANQNTYYADWNLAGVVQADISDGLHNSSVIGGYYLAKLTYDKILTIF